MADARQENGAGVDAPAPPTPQWSNGFVPWMVGHRLSLAFSSYQHGHLFFLGANRDGRPVLSRAKFPGAMGISASSQRVYLVSRMEIWRLENILAPGEMSGGLHDRIFVPRNAQTVGPVDAHELGIEPSGRMIFANTSYCCLAIPHLTHSFQPVWKPPFVTKLAPEDRCHLNGLAMSEGRAAFVTTCSTTDFVDGWREHRRDGGVVINVATNQIVAEGLSMPHSPRLHNGQLWVLNSGAGEICRVDLQSGKREVVAFCPGFLRGLAFVENFAIVTLSLPRKGRFQGLALDEELTRRGATPWCGVMVIDIRTGDIVHWLRFADGVNEIFDVAIIPGAKCPRGLTPYSVEMQEAVTFDALSDPIAIA